MAQTVRASVPGVCQAGYPGFQPRFDYRLCTSTLHLVLHQFTPLVCVFVLSTDRWIMGTGKEANKIANYFDKQNGNLDRSTKDIELFQIFEEY